MPRALATLLIAVAVTLTCAGCFVGNHTSQPAVDIEPHAADPLRRAVEAGAGTGGRLAEARVAGRR